MRVEHCRRLCCGQAEAQGWEALRESTGEVRRLGSLSKRCVEMESENQSQTKPFAASVSLCWCVLPGFIPLLPLMLKWASVLH